jgi:hypothetical protein
MQFRSPTDTVDLQGTVVKKDLEGGFFAIESDDGRVYDPINLPDRLIIILFMKSDKILIK